MHLKSIVSVSAVIGLSLLGTVSAHGSIQDPKPIKYDDLQGPNNYNPPLNHAMSDFPCKGMHMTPGAASKSWSAGGEGSFTINDAHIAAHSGGSCQASMSFDSGKTWQVLASFHGGCPRNANANAVQGPQTFNFPIPKDVPTGNALFAWTWYPVSGLRDMYMNCAVVNIQGGGPMAQSYSNTALPPMFVGAINGCVNDEDTNLLFPFPGPNVVNDTTTKYPFQLPKGDCDAPGTKGTGGGGPLNSSCMGPGPNLNTDAAGGGAGGSPAYGGSSSAGGAGAAPPAYSPPAPAAPAPPAYSAPAAAVPAPPAYSPPAAAAPVYATNVAGNGGGRYMTVTETVYVTVDPAAQPSPSPSSEVTVTEQMTITVTGGYVPTNGAAAPGPIASGKYGPGDENGIEKGVSTAAGVPAPAPTYGSGPSCSGKYGPGDENGIDNCGPTSTAAAVPAPPPPSPTNCTPKYGPGDENGIDDCSPTAAPLPAPTTGSGVPKYGPGDENGIEKPGNGSAGGVSKLAIGGCPIVDADSSKWSVADWKVFCVCLNDNMSPDAIKDFASIQHFCNDHFGQKAPATPTAGAGKGGYRKRWQSEHYIHKVRARHHH